MSPWDSRDYTLPPRMVGCQCQSNRTASGSDRPCGCCRDPHLQEAGRYRSRFCNSGQRFALIIFDVSYGVGQFLFCPKVFLAAAVSPWTLVRTPTTGIPHRPRRVCFERIQDRFGLTTPCYRTASGSDRPCGFMSDQHLQEAGRYHSRFCNIIAC